MKMRVRLLQTLLTIQGLTAMAGGLALMAGRVVEPSVLKHAGFGSLYFPGVILFALVGGSAVLALIANVKKLVGHEIASVLAGLILVFWIIGEMVSIRQVHVLQIVYLVLGVIIIGLTHPDRHKHNQAGFLSDISL